MCVCVGRGLCRKAVHPAADFTNVSPVATGAVEVGCVVDKSWRGLGWRMYSIQYITSVNISIWFVHPPSSS